MTGSRFFGLVSAISLFRSVSLSPSHCQIINVRDLAEYFVGNIIPYNFDTILAHHAPIRSIENKMHLTLQILVRCTFCISIKFHFKQDNMAIFVVNIYCLIAQQQIEKCTTRSRFFGLPFTIWVFRNFTLPK